MSYILLLLVLAVYCITPRFLLKFAVLFSGLFLILNFCVVLKVKFDSRLSEAKNEETVWIREDYEKASMTTVHLNGSDEEVTGHWLYSDDKVLVLSNQQGTTTIPKSSILWMDTGRVRGDRHKIAH